MLVLSRKPDEKIILYIPYREEPIEITVVRVDGNKSVRLGIEAEADITVLRDELQGKVKQEGR